ncbi:MAG: hypothetical protein U0168_21785 [Nannocystaceae bacterium]
MVAVERALGGAHRVARGVVGAVVPDFARERVLAPDLAPIQGASIWSDRVGVILAADRSDCGPSVRLPRLDLRRGAQREIASSPFELERSDGVGMLDHVRLDERVDRAPEQREVRRADLGRRGAARHRMPEVPQPGEAVIARDLRDHEPGEIVVLVWNLRGLQECVE